MSFLKGITGNNLSNNFSMLVNRDPEEIRQSSDTNHR